MKKRITIVTTVIIFAIILIFMTACNEKPQDVYTTLNTLTAKEYANVTVNVTTSKGGHTLSDAYSISTSDGQSTISYTVEELNTFDLVSGRLPENYKTVKNGVAKVEDGKVTEINGDEVSIEFEKIGTSVFTFKQEYFANVVETTDDSGNDIFSADISDIKAFMKAKDECVGAKIVVKYNKTEDKLVSIEISYSNQTSTNVQMSYNYN